MKWRFALAVASLVLQAQETAIVPGASLARGYPVAPDSIAALLGQGLPAELAGSTVTITDSGGLQHPATVLSASSTSITFLVPGQVSLGRAAVLARSPNRSWTASVEIQPVAPGVFSANGDGLGVAAAAALRVAADGAHTAISVARRDNNRYVTDPIDFGGPGDELYLFLNGSGFRRAVTVTATIAGSSVPVPHSGANLEHPGIDQITIGPVPRSLDGEVPIVLVADSIASNTVTAAFRGEPAPGQWGTRTQLLDANSEMGVAELNGKIYVIGGYPSTRVTVATVQVYDPSTNSWSRTTPLPVPLNHLMPVVARGKLYVIGGQRDANVAYVNTVYEYDPETALWAEKAPMPTARSAGAAVTIDAKIYVAGGRPPRGADFAVYDPTADRWETLPNLPTQRNHLIAVAVNGKIYVVGGRYEGGFQSPQTDALEMFDPVTGQWASRAVMLKPRGGINGVVANGCIHVFGGEGAGSTEPNGVYPDHDLYNPVMDQWTRVGRMPIPVHGVTGLAFINGVIHLPGGGTMDGGSSGSLHHQVYRPDQSCQ